MPDLLSKPLCATPNPIPFVGNARFPVNQFPAAPFLAEVETVSMTTPTPPWLDIVDELVEDILVEGGDPTPPVDALRIAQLLGISLATDLHQSGRARQKRIGNQPVFLVRPEDRPERLQWAVAHELGEVFAHRVVDRLKLRGIADELPLREEVANRFASRLLLPTRWFHSDAIRCQGDLPTLKEIYRTASHESIAWRLLDLNDSTVITICDQGAISARRGNFSSPHRLHPIEKAAWEEAHRKNRPSCREEESVRIQCWPIHELNWKREILRTTCTAFDAV